ncbi:hypothetical protein [Proteiniclasticum sp.]|nr:hypothetical protein [Proteiniclasticum sp.]
MLRKFEVRKEGGTGRVEQRKELIVMEISIPVEIQQINTMQG